MALTNHRNFIVVIDADCPDWEVVRVKILGMVLFDWVGVAEDGLEVYPAGDSDVEDLEMVEAMPPGEDPLMLRGLLTREEEERGTDRRVNMPDLTDWTPPI